jgi:hypothetical protein
MQTPRVGRDGSNPIAQRGADPGRLLPRAAVWLVWSVTALEMAIGALALSFGALNYDALAEVLTKVAPQALWAMSFPLVGAVIATHRPRNPLGWIFLIIGLCEGLLTFGYQYASYVFRTAPGAGPGRGAGRLGRPVGLGARSRAGAHLRTAAVP